MKSKNDSPQRAQRRAEDFFRYKSKDLTTESTEIFLGIRAREVTVSN